MSLIINQYDNSEITLNTLKSVKEDCLYDIVFAIELGFTNTINNRTFLNNHMLCFHYFIDYYEGEKNVSFEILEPNEETGEYFFEKYTCNFYKKNEKSRKIQIENSQLMIHKVKEPFKIEENELFESVIKKVKDALWNKHESILIRFKEDGINYSQSEMNDFSNKLKKFIDVSYKKLEDGELKPFIKEYQANALSANLSQKDKPEKKFKL